MLTCADSAVKLTLKLDGKKLKHKTTGTRKSSLNPYFNETFTFEVSLQQIQVNTFIIHHRRMEVSKKL